MDIKYVFQVGNYLRLFRGSLYKKYPGMYRRLIIAEERKKLADLGLNQHVLASNISLLRASEVEDVIEGREEKYRAVSIQTSEPMFPKYKVFDILTNKCLFIFYTNSTEILKQKNQFLGYQPFPTALI